MPNPMTGAGYGNSVPPKRKKPEPTPPKPGAGIKGRALPPSLIKSRVGEELSKKVKSRKMEQLPKRSKSRKMEQLPKKKDMVDYGYTKTEKGSPFDKNQKKLFEWQEKNNSRYGK